MPIAQEYLNQFRNDKEQITFLNLSDSDLTGELNLKGYVNLERLSVENNQLTSLDVRDCPKLKHLNIKSNPKLNYCYIYDLGKFDSLLSDTGRLKNDSLSINGKQWIPAKNWSDSNIQKTRIIPTKRHLRNLSNSSLNSNDSDREKELEKPTSNNNQSKDFHIETDFLPLTSQENEPEFQPTPILPISSVGTRYKKEVAKNNQLPRGSAFLTSSGELEKQGIINIIHAAPGSLSQEGEGKPDREAIIRATQNSVILAERSGFENLAIPFIGGNIFLPSIGGTKEQLAEVIIKSAINQRKQLRKIVFVPYGEEDKTIFENIWQSIKSQYPQEKTKGIEVKEGDITNLTTHNCSVIVNAANMEGQFGAGLSKIIGQATDQTIKINHEASSYIKKFNEIILAKKSDTKQLIEWLTDGNINQKEYDILENNIEDKEYSLAEVKELLLIEEWKKISLDFENQPNLIKSWMDKGFNYQQVAEWINIGFGAKEAELAEWLVKIKKGNYAQPEWILNHGNQTELRQEYQQYQVNPPKSLWTNPWTYIIGGGIIVVILLGWWAFKKIFK